MNARLCEGFIGPDIVNARPPVGARSAEAILRSEIMALRLVCDEELDTAILAREFPTLAIERVESRPAGGIVFDDYAWRGSFDFGRFDETIEQSRPVRSVAIRGDDAVGVACEVLSRYQRFIGRRNTASATPLFDAVLEVHAKLHEPSMTLVKEDFDHALDTWQWMLRLDPSASLAVQLAALFHDIHRLEGEPRERIEHRVVDPASGKDTQAHARRGAERAFAILCNAGMSEETAARVREIVAHERLGKDTEVRLLDDADALSFLSLASSVYADHFGLAQTRRKVAFTIARLGPRAREKLSLLRLRPDIERLLDGVAA
jgi:hypothetical protein